MNWTGSFILTAVMAKDLPYFKFIISEWNDGDVTLCSMEAQGLFINLCSLYWSLEGDLPITKAKRRYNGCNTVVWDELIAEGIIKIKGDQIVINFLDEQFQERRVLSEQNAKNIAKRWRNKGSDTTVLPSNNDRINPVYGVVYNKEERRREEKREEESDEYYQTKEIAFESMRDNELYIEECVKVLSARGWSAAVEIDIIALLKNFLNGKCDVTKPKSEVKQHFKNWIFREKIENLNTLATVFRNGITRKSA